MDDKIKRKMIWEDIRNNDDQLLTSGYGNPINNLPNSNSGFIHPSVGALDEYNYHSLDGIKVEIPNLDTLEGKGFRTQIRVKSGQFTLTPKFVEGSFLNFNGRRNISSLKINNLTNFKSRRKTAKIT